MVTVELLGAIALIVFGVRFLRKGLDRLFGGRLVQWLMKLTDHPVQAMAGGVAAGAIAPSSTALSLMAQRLIRRGPVRLEPILAALLGANIGMTIMVQLLTLNIAEFAGLLLALGVLGYQFSRRNSLRGVGQCVLGLGFVFLALGQIGEVARAFAANADFRTFMGLLGNHLWIVMLVGLSCSILLQSGTAAVGLAMGAAASGMLTLPMSIAWVVGVNFGLGLTTLAAGWASNAGRRLGIASLLAKAAVGLAAIALIPFLSAKLAALPGTLGGQLAWMHTGFNAIAALLALPLLAPLVRAADALSGLGASPEGGLEEKPATHLDEGALSSPPLALAHATRELQEMADAVLGMLANYWRAQERQDPDLARWVQQRDDKIDDYNKRLKHYLSRIGEGLHAHEARLQFALLGYANELETVGDIIDRNLCDTLLKQIAADSPFTPEDARDLATLYRQLRNRFEVAVGLLATQDPEQAAEFLSGKDSLGVWCRGVLQAHYEHLKRRPSPEALASSLYFLDLFNSLRRIHSHVLTIAYAFEPMPAAGTSADSAPPESSVAPA